MEEPCWNLRQEIIDLHERSVKNEVPCNKVRIGTRGELTYCSFGLVQAGKGNSSGTFMLRAVLLHGGSDVG